ncbi:MAG TPA: ABC transporter ATP-binding protein [Nocardioides sp.]|uniref:ABC transporter ATP-binding protein n=1 Tax=Nocardioides sp. TaxID=35761 RepID=UPI002B8B83B8|nr:ABC transporter ATP-binding protein [Nocardioides sp.]HQR26347.1 ABC transporter ATP-binding protein [Nocardioides sp.]
MPEPTLVVTGLSKSFGDLRAVDDLSFEVAPGETFGLLGPNGAGKTTTISMICGLLSPDAGSVSVEGVPIRPGSTDGRELIGYVPQELALYPDLSGRDNLTFFARLYGLRGAPARERIAEVLETVGLTERAADKVEEYSGGMQRRLNIAAGMLHRPRLLILDEPTVGIDPQSRNAILESVAALGESGMSVLYTTHYMEEAERLCRRVGIVDHGRLLACGTRRELVALVEQHDQVVITVAGDATAAAAALAGEPDVLTVSVVDDRSVRCMVTTASATLARLITRLADAGAVVRDVQVTEPSLDSVFLHITGTALRD